MPPLWFHPCSCYMHFSSCDILNAAWTCKNILAALWVLYLFVYLFSRWGSSKLWAPGVWERQTCWLLGYWETPPALISEKERDEEKDRRWERGKKEKCEWEIEAESEETRERKKQKDRWMNHSFHLSVLFVCRESRNPFFLPLLFSVLSPSCYLLAQNTED